MELIYSIRPFSHILISPRIDSLGRSQAELQKMRQNAAIHISIQRQLANKIRGFRDIFDTIASMREQGHTYREIGTEVADDLYGVDAIDGDINSQSLQGALGLAYRLDAQEKPKIDKIVKRIQNNRELLEFVLLQVEQAGSYRSHFRSKNFRALMIDEKVLPKDPTSIDYERAGIAFQLLHRDSITEERDASKKKMWASYRSEHRKKGA